MDCWQGTEIEYALPIDTDARRVFGVLEQMPGSNGASLLIPTPSKSGSFLLNGGKVYVDRLSANDILELCTPECRTPREALIYERALDRIVAGACRRLGDQVGKQVHCYKTSVAYADSARSSHTTRGLHESYLVESHMLGKLDELLPYLAVRPLFCGAGGYYRGRYVLSPRQFFIRAILAIDVHKQWPFIAQGKKPRTGHGHTRLHVCNGEAARCEVTSYLRNGVTALVIRAIELGLIRGVPRLRDPIATASALAGNVEGGWRVTLHNGCSLPAVDYLEAHYLAPIQRLAQDSGDAVWTDVVKRFEQALDDLRSANFERLARQVDWIVKLSVVEQHMEDYFDAIGSDVVAAREALDFQLKAVTDSTFDELERELEFERVTADEEIATAMTTPGADSRGLLRAELASELGQELEALEWDFAVVRGRRYSFPRLDGWSAAARQDEVMRIRRAVRAEEA